MSATSVISSSKNYPAIIRSRLSYTLTGRSFIAASSATA